MTNDTEFTIPLASGETIQVGDFLITISLIDGNRAAIYVDTTEGDALSVSSTADASGWGGRNRPAGLVDRQ